jgi:hypothetical protein
MRFLSAVCLLALVPFAANAEPIRIGGETKYKPHSLVRLKAEGVDAKAALLWRVYPSKDVQRATSPRGVLEFAAHPGTYEVELLVITNTDGVLSVEEARTSVTIESCTPVPPVPPKPDPKPPEGGKLDPVNALGRIRFGNAGCTATVIGPRRPDGRWDVLTAAHCVSGVGARGTLTLKDNRSFGIRVVAFHKTPDVAWHMGFGVDKPGNREDGTVAERENGQGQLRMVLSVSSGDSGGGIFRADTNELVSVVCCTSGMARKVSMWGCSAEVARRTRPKPADDADEAWVPVPIPICKDGKREDAGTGEWTPHPIPIRTVSSATK